MKNDNVEILARLRGVPANTATKETDMDPANPNVKEKWQQKPYLSHEARRRIAELSHRVNTLENALRDIVEIAPDDADSGARVYEIAHGALMTDKR